MHRDIYVKEYNITRYFDEPCQVLFIDEGNIDYVEAHLEEVIKTITERGEVVPIIDGEVDLIKACLMTHNYNGGIAYCDEVICGCCGGIVEMDSIYFLRVYDWIDITELIIGDDSIEEEAIEYNDSM